MRDLEMLVNSFVPVHEKEWEAKLFIDEAIKAKSEYALESIARALTGFHELKIRKAETAFNVKQYVKTDKDEFAEKTTDYQWSVSFMSFTLYANCKAGLWIEIIRFWLINKTVYPCGGANWYLNEPKSVVEKPLDSPKKTKNK